MKRRDFLRKSVGAGVAAGALLSTTRFNHVLAGSGKEALPYDMVALKGGTPAQMFDQGIAQLGGMKQFVKPNQTVVIKPNIGWAVEPERAANTNPELVKQVVKHCYDAGAKKVYVFDHTCNEWTKCYTLSGIEKYAKEAGAEMVPGNDEKYYHPVTIEKGVSLKEAKVHELILESDVIINIPVLKHHGGAKMSLAMKNLMGVVWDRGYWHKNDLQQCIADFATYCKPDLNIVDGYRVLMQKGPRGVSVDDVAEMKYQMISTDMVAVDTASVKVFGKATLDEVSHIGLAEKLGVGTTKLETLNIKRINI